jgi:hypothetical protein
MFVRYSKGCRCDACVEAERVYQRDYRLRAPAQVWEIPTPVPNGTPGPVEAGVKAEIGGLAAAARPGLAQAALALARILDNPKAVNQQPAAAKTLAVLLDKLASMSAHGRRGHLSPVREMTKKAMPDG